ncbi:hypothetical protein BDV96DRAFT_605374 [Lophiotrema nucula]|uniref:Uncharacterized protein n=1 Tax=Lophiotrema nucula TaxID=690887 RepID=A0A6A5YQC2_9PLEO|nr:hypothetical protein BDV96DRAFT_605374 [Lophiotrema nucula]
MRLINLPLLLASAFPLLTNALPDRAPTAIQKREFDPGTGVDYEGFHSGPWAKVEDVKTAIDNPLLEGLLNVTHFTDSVAVVDIAHDSRIYFRFKVEIKKYVESINKISIVRQYLKNAADWKAQDPSGCYGEDVCVNTQGGSAGYKVDKDGNLSKDGEVAHVFTADVQCINGKDDC